MGNNQQRIVFHNSPSNFDVSSCVLWLEHVGMLANFRIKSLNYHFVSREKIIEININHLNHNYATDIISFDYCRRNVVLGEIYLCLDVVEENALELGIDGEEELNRVIVHGLLHLLGFNDKTSEQQIMMREKENECLQLRARYE